VPIYEYQCADCGHQFEALQKLSDAPLEVCPQCQEAALRKCVSAPSFRLKGGGWYETDFKKSGQKNLAGDQGGGPSGAPSSEAKPSESKSSDTKPATSTATSTGSTAATT
jgi:putative FmdB family regulatory protein